jgi:glycosyltransferase involved in cell wall biosynthesis
MSTNDTKILFIMQAVTPGTHMDYVYEMARTLKEERGVPLELLVEKTAPAERPAWVKTQRFGFAPLRVLENFLLLLVYRIRGYQTFYIHYSFVSALAAGLITKVLGGTVYYWNAGMPWQYQRGWFEERYQRLAFRLIDVLVTGAAALVTEYSRYYKISPEQIRVIPNWIDRAKIFHDPTVRARVRQELHIPSDAPTLLFVQKLSKRKGADVLPAIYDGLNNPAVHLIIAGDGPLEASLHAWALHHPHHANIHFTGRLPREKMKELYQTADIFLLPSEEEGSPHSLIEAMAYGLPTTGFAVGGVVETAAPILHKHLHPVGDVAGLIGSIDYYVHNPAQEQIIKQELSAWVQKFDKPVVTQQFVSLLQ